MEQAPWGYNGYWGLEGIKQPGFGCTNSGGRPGRDKRSGRVAVDKAYFGGSETGGKRGRGTENKVSAAIAVQTDKGKVGCMR
ncbi:hypothetical protein Holit_03399 [Hollandina sp. SP2]